MENKLFHNLANQIGSLSVDNIRLQVYCEELQKQVDELVKLRDLVENNKELKELVEEVINNA